MSEQQQMAQVFGDLQNEFETAQASSGGIDMGDWPPPGEHPCDITGMDISPGKFPYKTPSEQKAKCDALYVRFDYELIPDPDDPQHDPAAPPQRFNGKGMPLVGRSFQAAMKDGNKTQLRIELERLKGHLTCILGTEPTNLEAAIQEVQAIISESRPSVLVQTKDEDYNGTTYHKEYLKEQLTSQS